MKRLLTMGCMVAALTGCATTDGLQADTKTSGFDNSRVVNIPAHGSACSSMLCTGLGAQWSSADPDTALLQVRVSNQIAGITSAQLSIDGQVERLTAKGMTNFDTSQSYIRDSFNTFVVPLSLVRRITASNKTWLRVGTTKGYVEDAIVDGSTDSKAYHAMKRFLTAVDSQPPSAAK